MALDKQGKEPAMKFRVDQSVLELFPHLTIGVVQGSGAAARSDLDAILAKLRQEALGHLRQLGLDGSSLTSHPHVAAWRTAYQRFGVKAKKHNPTHESLARRL